jgi:hypothetical protein
MFYKTRAMGFLLSHRTFSVELGIQLRSTGLFLLAGTCRMIPPRYLWRALFTHSPPMTYQSSAIFLPQASDYRRTLILPVRMSFTGSTSTET